MLKESGLVPQKTRSRFDAAQTYLDVDGDGDLDLFSIEMRYNPAASTPQTAALSIFRFLRKQADGTIVEDPGLLPQGNQACVHPRKAVLSDFNAFPMWTATASSTFSLPGMSANPNDGESVYVKQ